MGARPAFVADSWGPSCAGVLVARCMPVLLISAYLGPKVMTVFRERSLTRAINDLTGQVDPALFEATFKAPKAQLAELVQTKTVTLPQLVELLGPGVVDPTP